MITPANTKEQEDVENVDHDLCLQLQGSGLLMLKGWDVFLFYFFI